MSVTSPENQIHGIDPVQFGKLLWPNVSLYKKQREIVYSVRDNLTTVVPAGNMLGF